jgi:hypothetical protein
MTNTSKDESNSKNNPPSQPKTTDEVRSDIQSAVKPMETSNFSEGGNRSEFITMEIRNDSADRD